MKRLYFFLITIFVFAYANANPIDSLTAKTVAENFYALNSDKTIQNITLSYTDYADDGTPAYYVYNINENDGWIMVCADDRAAPILGYNTTGHFTGKNLPPQFTFLKDGYKKQISEIKLNKIQPTEEVKTHWSKLKQLHIKTNRIMKSGPLTPTQPAFYLVKTQWDQGTYYNTKCPGGSYAGCGATVIGQILKYWHWPNKGTGQTIAYTSSVTVGSQTYNYSIPSINLANDSYDWSDTNMPLSEINSSNNSAIATLLYHIGASINMQYSPKGSSSSQIDRFYAYINNFGYNSGTIRLIQQSDNPTMWISTLKDELKAGRPIEYRGDGKSGGHTWVCDGFDSNNLFHMNWGWSGYYNGYYSLDDLSNSNGNFTSNQCAIIGIQPACQTADLQFASMPTASNTAPTAGNKVNVYCQEYNGGSTYAGSNIVKVYISSSETLYNNYTELGTISFNGLSQGATSSTGTTQITIPSTITPGTYYLHFWADANQTIGECIENNNFAHIQINVTSSSNTCSPPSNDNASGAISITENASAINGISCGATGDASYSTCTNLYADDDVFYKFTATTSTVTVNVSPTSGTDYNPAFQLLSGSSLNNLQSVSPDCINNYGAGQTESQKYTNLITGNTYYIRVWHASTGYGTYGTFNISVSGTSCISPGSPYSLSPGTTSTTGQIIATTTPTLTWSVPSGANGYQVNISKYPYGYNNIVYTSDYLQTSSLTVPSGFLLNGYNYRWDVTAYTSANSSCYTTSADAYISVNTGTACSTPTTQSNNITFTGIDANNVTINWSVGNGERHIVKINTANSFNNITNGTTTNPSTIYAESGEQVVYDGSSSYVSVSGLSPNTTYYFKVYDANCSGGMSMYNNNTATNNPKSVTTITSSTTCTSPTTQPSNVTFSNVGTNSMTINWTNGDGSKRIVKMNSSYTFTLPVNGTDPSYNNYWNNAGEQIIYNGSGNSVTVTELSPNTTYYFKLYEANCSGNNVVYCLAFPDGATNGGSQATLNSNPVLNIPYTNYGSIACNGTYLYMLEPSSSYSLSWGSTNTAVNVYYDVEIREYPFTQSSSTYSQNCISGNTIYIPGSVLESGKLYAWKVRANSNCGSNVSNWSQIAYFGIRPTITPNESSITVCNGQGITLSAPILNIPSSASVVYQWYKESGNGTADELIGTNNSLYVSTTNHFYLKLIYSGSSECSGVMETGKSNTTFVSIRSTPQAPVLTSNSPVCEGKDLIIYTSGASGDYYFSGPNSFSRSAYNPNNITIKSVNKSAEGTYSCYIFDGCVSSVSTIDIKVNSAPIASYNFSVSGKNVTFLNSSMNAETYDWDFGDGQISTEANPIHTYNADGTYTVCLKVNKNGCNPSTYCQQITIGNTVQTQTLPTFAKLYAYSSNTNFIQSDRDSSFICIGSKYDSSISKEVTQFYKVGKDGKIIWAREILNTENTNWIPQVSKSNNGYILCFYNYSPFKEIILEVDEQGNTLWSKTVSSNAIFNILKVSDGYITKDGLNINKYDNSGNVIWSKTIALPSYSTLQTLGNNQEIALDASGNIYLICGLLNTTTYKNSGLIIKLNSSGNYIWSSFSSDNLIYRDIMIDKNNNNIICTFYDGYGYGIIKFNPSGVFMIAKTSPSTINAINIDDNINCILYSNINGIEYRDIVSFDSSLNMIKQKGLNFQPYYSIFKKSLDNKFVGVLPYKISSSPLMYKNELAKVSYSDVSCIDIDNATLSFDNKSYSFSSVTPTITSSSITTSSITIPVNVIALQDSDICHTCDLKAVIIPNGLTTFNQGSSVTLSANAGMKNYLWSNGAVTPSIAVTESGNYSVTVTDNYGCTDTSTPMEVTVTTGFFNTKSDQLINIYPNPTTGKVSISLSQPEDLATMELCSLDGSIIMKQTLNFSNSGKADIDVSNISQGIYMLHIIGKKNQGIVKLIKQ